jgi:hypothetical protein
VAAPSATAAHQLETVIHDLTAAIKSKGGDRYRDHGTQSVLRALWQGTEVLTAVLEAEDTSILSPKQQDMNASSSAATTQPSLRMSPVSTHNQQLDHGHCQTPTT